MPHAYRPETICSQVRRPPKVQSSSLVPPIVQSAAYIQADVDQAHRIYEGTEEGYTYAREGHPNAAELAGRLAALEGTDAAVVTGSGMSAIAASLVTVLGSGDRVVASDQIYGRSTALLAEYLVRMGVHTDFVTITDLAAVGAALAQGASLLFFEVVSNPLLRVADMERLAPLARRHSALVVVDNTIPTPLAARPVEFGADLVVHSLTKLVAGHSDVTLGAVCGTRAMIDRVQQTIVTWGLTPSPMECWLADRGLGTLALRWERSTRNAALLAGALGECARVRRVIYPGSADHPDYEVAHRLLGEAQGNMVSFELDGGAAMVNRFFRALQMVPFSPTLGHLSTIVSHPASTSHRGLSPAARAALGITDGLVRVSVGVEAFDDLWGDFIQALDAAG